MRKHLYFLIVALFVAGIALAGCSGGADEGAKEQPAAVEEPAAQDTSHSEETAPATKEAEAAKPAEESADNKMEELCDKLAEEMKNAGVPAFGADHAVKTCREGVKDADNADAANMWAAKVLKACEDKKGQEWFTCYSEAAQKATF